ncbi:MAG: class I SAM-dependent methyltransferase, partial [Myxococcales bacterium]|nr:class I SAM-dependent methyltransferase [Myxococcales bacterium]
MTERDNREQVQSWGEAGPAWVRQQERIDAQMAPHAERALALAEPAPGERVADVGCGCGTTTLLLAERVGAAGSALGVDVSPPMLEHARRRARSRGLSNVRFVEGDAQTFALESPVDLVFSRFGVMFFAAPEVAFRNLRSWLAPDGRLTFVCWQARERNPWISVPARAAGEFVTMPDPPGPGAPGMFSLADETQLRLVLSKAGFRDVEILGEEIPIRPQGGSAEEAAALFMDIGPVPGALTAAGADADLRRRVRERMVTMFEEHAGPRGVELDSAVWIVR